MSVPLAGGGRGLPGIERQVLIRGELPSARCFAAPLAGIYVATALTRHTSCTTLAIVTGLWLLTPYRDRFEPAAEERGDGRPGHHADQRQYGALEQNRSEHEPRGRAERHAEPTSRVRSRHVGRHDPVQAESWTTAGRSRQARRPERRSLVTARAAPTSSGRAAVTT